MEQLRASVRGSRERVVGVPLLEADGDGPMVWVETPWRRTRVWQDPPGPDFGLWRDGRVVVRDFSRGGRVEDGRA